MPERPYLFRSRFFWNLYLTYALVVVATSATIGLLVDHQMENALLDEVQNSLRDKATLLSSSVRQSFSPTASRADAGTLTSLLAVEAAARVTLIYPDGTVLADSQRDPSELDNHLQRPEVQQALHQSFGYSRRYSQSVGHDLLYVARALRENGQLLGIVRVSIPLQALEAQLALLRASIAGAAFLGVGGALVLGILIGRQVTRPLLEMIRIAGEMRRGNYESRVTPLAKGELGILGGTLNLLGSKVSEQIATIYSEQSQLRSMVAGIPVGIVAVDGDDRVLFANTIACRILGRDPERMVGQKLMGLGNCSTLPPLVKQARQLGAAPAEVEFTVPRNVSESVISAHAAPFAGGAPGSVVVVLEDITNLKRLETIRRDFVANVSHEIKTPLTSIKGYVETLVTGAIHDEQNNMRFLRKIEDHVGRLTNLVQDLLSLARIEAHEGSLRLVEADWRPVVAGALRRYERALQERGLSCSVDLDDMDYLVVGDTEAMTQVLDNLLDNAIKYTPPPGNVRIRLSQADGTVTLVVEDTGIGIPAADRERIFERFYRVDKARSREMGGTGLGLSIVKHLVQAMHGDVRVDSDLGRGSRFTVTLPAAFMHSPVG